MKQTLRCPTVAIGTSLAALLSCTKASRSPPACPELATSDAVAATQPADPLQDMDARAERAMSAFDVPGLSLAIVRGGRLVLARGYGVRERGKSAPVDEHTIFAVASNTKPFVATVLGLLASEGKLSWDDRVLEHLPRLRTWDEHTTRSLRIRDLVSHRSGLDTWAGDLLWIGSAIETAEIIDRLPEVPAKSGFRERYGYTNLMFVVAGEVIRAATGKAWDAVVRERLLDPLGMARTTSSVKELSGHDNVATPHMEVGDELRVIPYLNVDNAGAAAALNSSAADMASWVVMQLGDGKIEGRQIVPAEVVRALRVPHTPIPVGKDDLLAPNRHFSAYGLGWFLYDYRGRLVVTHSGGLPGMTSRVAIVPEEELGIVVLTNSETSVSQAVVLDILDGYLGGHDRDWVSLMKERSRKTADKPVVRQEAAAASLAIAGYVGMYDNPLLGYAEIHDQGGSLQLRIVEHGGLDCPLVHAGGDVFRCVWRDPIFGVSDVSFSIEKNVATKLSFRVRPEFIDPLEYAFARKRGRSRPAR